MNIKSIEQFDVLDGDAISLVQGGASVCDWVVGGSGIALSTLYGAAVNAAFGNFPGAIASVAVGLVWIPVSAACP